MVGEDISFCWMFQRVSIRPKDFPILVGRFSTQLLFGLLPPPNQKPHTQNRRVGQPIHNPFSVHATLSEARWLVSVVIFFVGTASGADDAMDGQASEMSSCGRLGCKGQGHV